MGWENEHFRLQLAVVGGLKSLAGSSYTVKRLHRAHISLCKERSVYA